MGTRGRIRSALLTAVAAGSLVAVAACTAHTAARSSDSPTPVTRTTVVGTSTVTSTARTTNLTLTVVPSSASESAPSTTASSPKSSARTTALPAAVIGECPYIAAADVMSINGQHHGPTSIIPVKPYPICIFTRSDGGYMATTRIIVAETPADATAAVNSYVPVAESFPVDSPAGWSGGAMALPNGNADNADNRSIYAVSKGNRAVIAESNQLQSIKGRQMVEQIVKNLGW